MSPKTGSSYTRTKPWCLSRGFPDGCTCLIPVDNDIPVSVSILLNDGNSANLVMNDGEVFRNKS